MNAKKLLLAGVAMAVLASPAAAFALTSAGSTTAAPDPAVSNLGLDELTPSVQYKVDYSEAENVKIAEWLTEQGIAYRWHDEPGSSRYVEAEEWTDEAQAAMVTYNENYVWEEFPEADVAEVNAEVDAIIAALDEVGISAQASYDEEGFKDLTVDIANDDPNATALWDQANDVIASMGS